ncbi:MAG: transporter [Candidatus Saccharibacteria bacterium]|nr:transporter [Candidatus Saccharibacteria bacterium]
MTKQQRLVLIISILASFVAFLDSSIINVALPAIVKDLGGGLAAQQWIVDAYLITLGSLILLAGSLSDLFGRKKILMAGLVGFGVASLLCAVAPSSLFLIIARGLQGIAGALIVPSSLALIMSAFEGSAKGKAIGTWTGWTGISFIVGPLLGGLLVDSGSWRFIFAINILPIAITLWLMRSLAHEAIKNKVNIDSLGAVLGIVGLGGPVFALIEQSRYGWSSPRILAPLIVGILSFLAFLWHENNTKEPMLPLGLFAVRNFSVGNIATVAIYGGLSLATFLISVFLQQVSKFSAVEAGLSLMPITIIMFFLSGRFGALAGKFGPRFFMTAGPLLASLGFLTMLRVQQHVHYASQLLPGVLLFGLGLSLTVAPLTTAILGAINSKQSGIGSAINNAVSRVAGLVSIAFLGVIIGPTLNVASFHKGILVVAALFAIGGLVSAVGISNKKLS